MISPKKSSPIGEDDDTEVDGIRPKPNMKWEDDQMQSQILRGLNNMRKNKHFCDVVLQIGKQDLYAHRAVLAAASPYLMDLFNSAEQQPTRKEMEGSNAIIYQLNGGFDKRALEKLIEFAYTGKLDVSSYDVKSIYLAAARLRMDRVAIQCADFLISHIDIETCIELRALPGVARLKDLVLKVDEFIDSNITQLLNSKALLSIDRICIEVLHNTREELEAAEGKILSHLILDWIHSLWLNDESLTLSLLKEKTHLLHMPDDKSGLQDCADIAEGSEKDSEIIQDYKKNTQQIPKATQKVRRHSSQKNYRHREYLFSRHINQEDTKTEDHEDDWKVISTIPLDGKSSIFALITIDGYLFKCSIVQRVNKAKSGSSKAPLALIPVVSNESTIRARPQATIAAVSREMSRPSSKDRDLFVPVMAMEQAKCAEAVGLRGQLYVCGGFDRGQCLDTVCKYDPQTNSWLNLKRMNVKRGRFDVAVKDNRYIYAVGGSSGQMETNKAERYDVETNTWKFIASLPDSVSNIGLCNLDDVIYCVGGTFGQAGNRHCYRLNDSESKWERIANLHVGRSQAAVTSFQGKIWVVGGCDAWNPVSTVEIYDPNTNTWQFGPPMNCPRRGCGLIAKDDLLYVIGGSDGTQSLCTTEVFDPRINLWTSGPTMTTCRGNVSIALVNGYIWAVGGFSGKAFLNTIEYLDPKTDEWNNFIMIEELKAENGVNENHSHGNGLDKSVDQENNEEYQPSIKNGSVEPVSVDPSNRDEGSLPSCGN